MRNQVLILLCLVCLSLTAQEEKDSGNIKKPEKITSQHRLVEGTHIYIIPPLGFFSSREFTGFENSRKESIRLFDLAESIESQKIGKYGRQNIINSGARILDNLSFDLDGYPAFYYLSQIGSGLMLLTLCMGDSSFTAVAQASFRAFDEEALESVRTSLLSIVYDKLRVIPPFEGVFFTLDYSNSPFHLAEVKLDTYTFTLIGGEKPGPGEPYFTLSYLPTDPSTTALSISEMMLAKLIGSGKGPAVVRKSSTRTINGSETFEREILLHPDKNCTLLYQAIILYPEYAVVFHGFASADFGQSLEIFKSLASTIKEKGKDK